MVKISPSGLTPRISAIDEASDVSSTAPTVLLLCTGNICRSPMAEGLLRQALARHGVPAEVLSAGTSFDGRPAEAEAVKAMAALGIDISDHRSRLLDRALVDSADLVLGMERVHVREAVLASPAKSSRIFTLKELVRRAELAGPRAQSETLEAWLGRLDAGRSRAELIGLGGDDGVADPFRQSYDAFRRCAAELAEYLDRVVAAAWPRAEGGVA